MHDSLHEQVDNIFDPMYHVKKKKRSQKFKSQRKKRKIRFWDFKSLHLSIENQINVFLLVGGF